MNYNNMIGFLLFIIYALQLLSGLLLCCYYSAYYKIAFDSIMYIMSDINMGWFISFIHVIGASLFLLFIFIHLISGLWIKFKIIYLDSMFNMLWLSGLLLLSLSLLEGFIGYILLWGQMSYWGITVMLNMLSMMPYFGYTLLMLLWCSSKIMVYRVFMFHFTMGMIIGLFMFMHIFFMHSFNNINPFINSNSTFIMPFYPFMYKDLFIVFMFLLYLLSLMLFWEPDMFGNADNTIMANPLITPKNMLPEWYYLCFYCCLSCFPDKTMGFLIVVLLFLLLI